MTLRTDIFEGLNVLLVTEDETRAQALAKALRDRKASVGDVKAPAKDPVALRGADLLVVDSRSVDATRTRVGEMRADVRARWAAVATVDYAKLVLDDGAIYLSTLEEAVGPLTAPDKALIERAKQEEAFSTTLAPLGPTRMLRALALAGPTLHVELNHPTLTGSVDLSNELLVCAFAERDGQRWEAWAALARIFGLTDAEVTVSRRAHASAMNIMEPINQALEVAAQERVSSAELIALEERKARANTADDGARTGAHPAMQLETALAAAGQKPEAASAHGKRTMLGMAPGGVPASLPAPSKPPVPSRYAYHADGAAPPAPAKPGAGRTIMGIAPGALPALGGVKNALPPAPVPAVAENRPSAIGASALGAHGPDNDVVDLPGRPKSKPGLSPVAAPAKALSSYDDIVDLPGRPTDKRPPEPPREPEIADLPAPRAKSKKGFAPVQQPAAAPLSEPEIADLPAPRPKSKQGLTPVQPPPAAPLSEPEIADLPAPRPKSKQGLTPVQPPPAAPLSEPDITDLPAPRAKSKSGLTPPVQGGAVFPPPRPKSRPELEPVTTEFAAQEAPQASAAPNVPAKPTFGDVPTDPAAPGLLARMAAESPPSDPPTNPPARPLSFGFDDDSEATTVTDSARLDALREQIAGRTTADVESAELRPEIQTRPFDSSSVLMEAIAQEASTISHPPGAIPLAEQRLREKSEETLVMKRVVEKAKSRAGVLTLLLLFAVGEAVVVRWIDRKSMEAEQRAQAALAQADAKARKQAQAAKAKERPAQAQPEVNVGQAGDAPSQAATAGQAPTGAPAQPTNEAKGPPANAAPAQPAHAAAAQPASAAQPANAAPAQPAAAAEKAPPAQPSAAPAEPEPAAAAAEKPADAPTTSNVDQLVREGTKLLAEHDASSARAAFEKALALDPKDPHARAGLSDALLALGQVEEARTAIEDAIKLRPRRARYRVQLGDVLKALGRPDEARAAWQKALDIDPKDREALRRLGQPESPPETPAPSP